MIALDEALTSNMSTAPRPSLRPSLDLRSAELATIAALTALRYPPQQLKVHIKGALTAGCSPEEIMEVILQTALYAGLPAAFDAMALAEEPFRAHAGSQPRLKVTHGSFGC